MPRNNSEYARQCSYESGPDHLGRMIRCQGEAGHKGNHPLLASWLFSDANPYGKIWDGEP